MEFETQAECLGWSKPQLLNTDHGETFTATKKKGTDSTDENDPLSSFKNVFLCLLGSMMILWWCSTLCVTLEYAYINQFLTFYCHFLSYISYTDYEKCAQFDEDMDEDKLSEVLQSFFQKTLERMKTTYHLLTKCMAEGFISYFPSLF